MHSKNNSMDSIIRSLEERAKELNCLYTIEEILSSQNKSLDTVFMRIIAALPPGWQFPDYCHARIKYDNEVYVPEFFFETPYAISADINVKDETVGTIEVFYTIEFPPSDEGPFLKEERKLINTIADRVGNFIFHLMLKQAFSEWNSQKHRLQQVPKPEWNVVLDLLRRTDQHLFSIISRKMINHLFCKGIPESKQLFIKLGTFEDVQMSTTEVNRPTKKQVLENSYNLGIEIFNISSKYFNDGEILSFIQKWINEEKTFFLVKSLNDQSTPLGDVADAIRRYYHIKPDLDDEVSANSKGIRVSLIRKFLTDQLDFINIAKNYIDVKDFYSLIDKVIIPSDCHGKVGGKSAGLFLAKKIIDNSDLAGDLLSDVKTPKTWYMTSDSLMNFIYYNNLEEAIEQKYRDIDDIRAEYPHMIQAFKNSHFAPEVMNGLSRALDDFGENPIIVRSSSLLEDRIGSAFAGKYKSLFLANQGSKQERLDALMDAIAEVYASTFGPDPIGYRTERGLLDFNEEMGIMIQEVVGTKVGKYFFPAFAGVAFSNNEFRWTSRIKKEDGLIRIVPGLGTRAVDRIGNDYPVLVAPGQPGLRVNLTFEEIIGYSPKNVDVINLEKNTFETLPIKRILREVGNQFPMKNEIFSIQEENILKKPVGLGVDVSKNELVVTFENLITNTKYIKQIHAILNILKDKLGSPVDIEFAFNDKSLYLLQCRAQSSTSENVPAQLPRDIAPERILFNAKKYVSNGKVPDILYIVYVDPMRYAQHTEIQDLIDVGVAVGRLNKILPKKSFVLMGPGRWGSRDDIRLGVKVSYSDINNTAVLIEIARKKGNYEPDLSFGTHFFQDLVESAIRYLPLYPDDPGIVFNEKFLLESENSFNRFLPGYEHIADTVRVINVQESTNGLILRVLMNADEDEAMAVFAGSSLDAIYDKKAFDIKANEQANEHLIWRMRMVDNLSACLDASRFGILGVYLYGTVFNKTAGAKSDIDLLVYYEEKEDNRKNLLVWLEAWNQCLRQIYYRKTGVYIEKILDFKLVTEADIKNSTYFQDLLNPKNRFSRKLKLVGQD